MAAIENLDGPTHMGAQASHFVANPQFYDEVAQNGTFAVPPIENDGAINYVPGFKFIAAVIADVFMGSMAAALFVSDLVRTNALISSIFANTNHR